MHESSGATAGPCAQARGVRVSRRPSRWVGTLFCLSDLCDTVLAEVLADDDNMTYIQPIGAARKYTDRIPCPKCGAIRPFESTRVRPLPPEHLVDLKTKVA